MSFWRFYSIKFDCALSCLLLDKYLYTGKHTSSEKSQILIGIIGIIHSNPNKITLPKSVSKYKIQYNFVCMHVIQCTQPVQIAQTKSCVCVCVFYEQFACWRACRGNTQINKPQRNVLLSGGSPVMLRFSYIELLQEYKSTYLSRGMCELYIYIYIYT